MSDKLLTYENLDRPYDDYMARSQKPEINMYALSTWEVPWDLKPVKTGNYLDDIFLETWIKSSFFKPHRQWFYLDWRNWYVEINWKLVIWWEDIWTGISMSSNDIFLFDNSVWGTNPVTGNTSSILFVNSNDTDPLNPVLSQQPRGIIQKRKGVNNNNENVLEIFYDQRAIWSWKNYIFIGQEWWVSRSTVDINDFQNNITQMSVSDWFWLRIFSEHTGDKPLSLALVNDNYVTMNSHWSRFYFISFNTDPDDPATPANLTAWTWAGGGIVFWWWQSSYGTAADLWLVMVTGNMWSWVNFSPLVNEALDLWTSSYWWNNLYVKTVNLDGNLIFSQTAVTANIQMPTAGLGIVDVTNWGSGYTVGDILDVVQAWWFNWQVKVWHVTAWWVVDLISVQTAGYWYSIATGVTTSWGTGTLCTIHIIYLTWSRTYTQQQITYKDGSGNNQTKWLLAS